MKKYLVLGALLALCLAPLSFAQSSTVYFFDITTGTPVTLPFNDGATPPVAFNVGESDIAAGPDGTIIVATGTEGAGAKVMLSRSPRPLFGARVWGAPVTIFTCDPLDQLADHGKPKIATNGLGLWILTWTVNDERLSPATDPPRVQGLLYVSRSTDDGATWSTPAVVNNPFGVNQWGYPVSNTGVTTDPVLFSSHAYTDTVIDKNGNAMIVWTGGSVSTIYGPEPAPGVDPPVLQRSYDDDGWVIWSTDQGATWTNPRDIGDDMDYPKVEVNDDGAASTWMVIGEYEEDPGFVLDGTTFTFTDNVWGGIRSTDMGATWTEISDNTSGGGEIPIPYVEYDKHGDIVYCGGGIWTTYFNVAGTDPTVARTMRSTDDGLHWVYTDPIQNIGEYGQGETDGTGNVVINWERTDTDGIGFVISGDSGLTWSHNQDWVTGMDADDPSQTWLFFTPESALKAVGATEFICSFESDDTIKVAILDAIITSAPGPYRGAPVAGIIGLGVLSSVLALAGAALVRKK